MSDITVGNPFGRYIFLINTLGSLPPSRLHLMQNRFDFAGHATSTPTGCRLIMNATAQPCEFEAGRTAK